MCRRDVRGSAQIDDAVAFFCAKPDVRLSGTRMIATGPADYYFIGCGTIADLVDRHEIWRLPQYKPYRTFYNVLAKTDARGRLRRHEALYPDHRKDWRRRANAHYVLFDPERTFFNIEQSRRVSRYEPAHGVPDQWRRDKASRKLEQLLFADRRDRRLRTSHTGYGHAQMTIRRAPHELRTLIDKLVDVAASS